MSFRPASAAWLVAFETRLAWRRVAGERQRLAIAAMAVFWLALHAAALDLLGKAAAAGSSGPPTATLGMLTLLVLFAVLATAFGLAVHGLFERADLALVTSAPVPAGTAWAARLAALAAGAGAFPAYFVLPFAHAAAWHGWVGALAAYPAIVAFALSSVSVATLATLGLVRLAGARRARVLAQVAGALAGAAIFLAFQSRNLLPEGARSSLEAWISSDAGRWWTGEASPFWWPLRAVRGEPIALGLAIAVAAVTFALAKRLAARAQAAGLLEPMPPERVRAGPAGRTARFGGSLARLVIAKEWRLVARDPRAILHLLLPLLYLAPLLVLALRRDDARLLLAPSVVVLAGFLAGGLAWLSASGEEAPDLLASAPLAAGRVFRLKLAAAALPAMAVSIPFVVTEALRSPGSAAWLLSTLAGSVAGSALVQLFAEACGARRDFARNAQPGRLVALVEHLGAAGWGLACWGALAGSAWGFAGLAIGLAAPALAFAMRPRRD